MSLVSTLKTLLIPLKSSADTTDLDTDWRAIEIWAQQVVAAIKSISGGGGGVAEITSTNGTIDITAPTGPITNIQVDGYPFLQYGDTHGNTGYGVLAHPRGSSGTGNSAFGFAALDSLTSGGENTALGDQALTSLTSGIDNTAVGALALSIISGANESSALGYAALGGATTGPNDAFGYRALAATTTGTQNCVMGASGYAANTAGNNNTGMGFGTNAAISGVDNTTSLGCQTSCSQDGGVAIGIDHTGASAQSTGIDVIALGTGRHQVQISNNTTGSGSALLGANCPASSPTAPQTWLEMMDASGNTVYVPAWK